MKKALVILFVLNIQMGFAQSELITKNPLPDFNILKSFYQGSANNCASVALIKAGMHRYGYNKMFTYSKEDGKFKVTLQDGIKLIINEQEFLQAKSLSKFEINEDPQLLGSYKDSILFYAYLAYASIAKNIEKNG